MIKANSSGLVCEEGGFSIDSKKSAKINILTHAHSDHAVRGSKTYIASPETYSILKKKWKNANIKPLDYKKRITLGKVTISLHPAGHVLGSSQIRIEKDGIVWVAAGDYKRHQDPSCKPFETIKCHVFITESTFGKPKYIWPNPSKIFDQSASWIKKNSKDKINSVLRCYSLGKAQRVLLELEVRGINKVYVNESILEINKSYEKFGIRIRNAYPIPKTIPSGSVIMSSRGTEDLELGEYESAFFSGWTLDNRFREKGFAISDHADFPSIIQTCRDTGAKEILTIHGETKRLAKELIIAGLKSRPLEKIPLQTRLEEFFN